MEKESFLAIVTASIKYNLLPKQQIAINTDQLTMLDNYYQINIKMAANLKYKFLYNKNF